MSKNGREKRNSRLPLLQYVENAGSPHPTQHPLCFVLGDSDTNLFVIVTNFTYFYEQKGPYNELFRKIF
jgi:hypothetical protein